MKKYYSIALTILFFSIVTSVISPTVTIEGNAQVKEIEEDFSTSPTPKSSGSSASPQARSTSNQKTIVYKGEISATPSSVGKFLVSTADGQKNVDTDKSTKVYIFDKGIKTASTVARIRMGDNSATIGQLTEDGKALLAKYILITRNPLTDKPRSAKYGLVSSREASGTAAFILQIKSPSKDEKVANYTVNAETVVKVKDIDTSKLSDIKIGDRVTFTYYVDEKTGQNIITRIFVIPGRASGLLKDLRDASAAAEKQARDEQNLKSTAKPTVSPSGSSQASPR
ncbi:MAG: hypothetical protein M3Q44_01885 [bacterium]|nr:hypothetical protein [bacterium]